MGLSLWYEVVGMESGKMKETRLFQNVIKCNTTRANFEK